MHLEIIDDKNNVIFSLDVLKDNVIKIQGIMIWKHQHGITIVGDKEMLEGGNFDNQYHDSFNTKFKRLFVYTGMNWLHKRVKKN